MNRMIWLYTGRKEWYNMAEYSVKCCELPKNEQIELFV